MQTIVCRQPGELRRLERDPNQMGPGQALIRIRRIGVCGTDFHAFQGNQPYFTYPRVLGHELSGVIEAIDPDLRRGLQIGDVVAIVPYLHCGQCVACRLGKPNCCVHLEVFGVHRDGGMQETLAVPTTHLVKAEGLSLDQAAILEPLSIGAHAVRRAALKPGEVALVIGAGPIGLGVMALAHQRGAKILVIDGDADRLRFAQTWCPVEAALPAGDHPEDQLASLTQGDWPSVVFDATGNVQSMSQAVSYVAHGGRVVYVGLSQDTVCIADPLFHQREVTLLASRNATREDFATAHQAVRERQIASDAYISQKIPWDDLIEAFPALVAGQRQQVKTLIEV